MAMPERDLAVETIGKVKQISLGTRLFSMSALKRIVHLQIEHAGTNYPRFITIEGRTKEHSLILGPDDLERQKQIFSSGDEKQRQRFFDRLESVLQGADQMVIIERSF